MNKIIFVIIIILLIFLFGVGVLVLVGKSQEKGGEIEEVPVIEVTKEVREVAATGAEVMTISSSAFDNNGTIPQKYTCDGEDINPPVNFGEIPSEAKSLVLIVDDPDAPVGVWSHWLVWNIAPTVTSIEENIVPEGAVAGKNDFGNNNYGGPCPPSGTHRYRFKLFALDTELDIPENSKQKDVEAAVEGHVLAQAELVGTYER